MRYGKHFFNASTQPKLQRVMERFGYAGLGFYWFLWERIGMNEGRVPLVEVVELSSRGMRRVDIMELLGTEAFGLFDIDAKGQVWLCEEMETESMQPSCNEWNLDTGAQSGAGDCAQGGACAGYLVTNRKEEIREEKEEGGGSSGFRVKRGGKEPGALVQRLLGHESEIWRESLVSQIREYDLVMRHWAWCVEYFAAHLATAGAKSESLAETRKHFVYFTRNKLSGARFYMELHRHDKEVAARQAVEAKGWQEAEAQFQEYMHTYCPHLMEMEDPLTLEEYQKLRNEYGKEAVRRILLEMENKTELGKRSCYATAKSWLQKDKK